MTAQLTGHNNPCTLMVGGQQEEQDQYSIEELASGRGHGSGPKSGWSLEHRRELAV